MLEESHTCRTTALLPRLTKYLHDKTSGVTQSSILVHILILMLFNSDSNLKHKQKSGLNVNWKSETVNISSSFFYSYFILSVILSLALI